MAVLTRMLSLVFGTSQDELCNPLGLRGLHEDILALNVDCLAPRRGNTGDAF